MNKQADIPAHTIVKSTTIVASMTMISRVLGFVRDVIFALIFGAGPAFDAFVVAFKLPNFMRRLFAEGAFSQAFVPVLSEYRATHDHEEVQKFVNHITGTLGLVLLLVVIFAELCAPLLITIFAPGFLHDSVRYAYSIYMLKIMFPYLLLMGLTALSGAILNTYNRFALAAFTPVVLNVVLIFIAWFVAPYTSKPIFTLAWGVLLGGVVQLVLQFPFLKNLNLLPKIRPTFKDPGVRRVMKLMVPALFGVSVAQISFLIDNMFASFLQAGSISWLYYSDRLIYLPQGLIGVTIATVMLPHLSRHHAKKDKAAYSSTLDWSLRLVALVGLPCTIGLFFLSGPILATLIHHGAFNDFDVVMTAKSLRAFAIGLPAFMLVKILASAFYSRQNIKTPVKIAVIAVAANIIFILCLIHSMAHAGLALATSLSSTLNAILLFAILWKNKIFKPNPGWFLLFIRLLISNSCMAFLIYWLSGDISQWLQWHLFERIWHLGLIISLGVLAYFCSLLLLGLRVNDLRPQA